MASGCNAHNERLKEVVIIFVIEFKSLQDFNDSLLDVVLAWGWQLAIDYPS
jgi:hypothetical protein